jgi:hypothetical protein
MVGMDGGKLLAGFVQAHLLMVEVHTHTALISTL